MHRSTALCLLGSMAMGLADAAAVSIRDAAPANVFKRWNHYLCNCDLATVPIPDSVTFQLPLEGYRQDLCYALINPTTNAAAGEFCWDFNAVSDALTLKFKPGTGVQYQGAQVGLSTTPSLSIPPAYTTSNGKCSKDAASGEINCSIPWTDISGKTALRDVLAAMCPNGPFEGLILYMDIKADTVLNGQSCTAVPRPCDASKWSGSCNPTAPYFELAYRCTACPSPPEITCDNTPPPVTKTCDFGTAFGYSEAYSKTLQSISGGTGCNRWGWYEQIPYADLNGASGPLYVGAGRNDIDKATHVGDWTALVSGGKVSITYTLSPGYSLGEVHVDVRCSVPNKCAPGQYTYGKTFAADATTPTFTTAPIAIPCTSGKVDIIIHAAVDTVVPVPADQADTYTCPAPKNTP